MPSHKKSVTWLILISGTLSVMAGAIIAPVLSLMGDGLGVDAGQARILITTHSIFIAVFSPLYGILIDRIGPKKPLVFGLILYGIAGGAGLFVNDYWLLFACRSLLGIGAAAIFTTLTILVFNLYAQGAERNRVMGWRASSQSAGGIVWPLLGGFLGTFSWHFPFAVYLVGIPLGVLALLFIPRSQSVTAPDNLVKDKSVITIFRETPMLFGIYFLIFINSIFLYGIVIFLPEILKGFNITSSLLIGLYISGMSFMAAVSAFTYGKVKEKFSYKTIIVTILALWATGFSLLSVASNSVLTGISIAFFGAGQGMMMPTLQLWSGELVPASFRGRITSYLGSFGLGGQFLSPIILSPLASSLGLSAVFLGIALTSVLVFVVFFVFVRQKQS